MITNEFREYAESAIIHTYNRFPVVFDHGDGVYLYDTNGKKYLDFAAGIAVNAFGYNVEEYKETLKNQMDKLMHISNLYYTEPMADAAHKLAKASGLKRVFLPTVVRKPLKGPSRWLASMPLKRMERQITKLLPWNILFMDEAWAPFR